MVSNTVKCFFNITFALAGQPKFAWGIDDFDLGKDLKPQIENIIKDYDANLVSEINLTSFNRVDANE